MFQKSALIFPNALIPFQKIFDVCSAIDITIIYISEVISSENVNYILEISSLFQELVIHNSDLQF